MSTGIPSEILDVIKACAVVWGAFWALLNEKWPAFQMLASWQKLLIQVVLAAAGGIIILVLLTVSQTVGLTTLNNAYVFILSMISGLAGNFGTHVSYNQVIKPLSDKWSIRG